MTVKTSAKGELSHRASLVLSTYVISLCACANPARRVTAVQESSSHRRDPVHFHVSRRIVAVSANDALLVHDVRLRRQTLQPGLEEGAGSSATALPEDCTGRDA